MNFKLFIVKIMPKIYTKTGDTGKTSLLGGQRVEKFHNRIEAYGTVDELNSFIGLLICETNNANIINSLLNIQNKLFNAGSKLAVEGKISFQIPEIIEDDIEFLEKKIDEMNEELPELKNFILPGGNRASSLAHVCRTVCRRAERRTLSIPDESNMIILKYLNRLSDYFFVLSRKLSDIDNEKTWNT